MDDVADACFLTLAVSLHAQTAPLFNFEPKPGPYGVGLKVVEQYDHIRVYRSLP